MHETYEVLRYFNAGVAVLLIFVASAKYWYAARQGISQANRYRYAAYIGLLLSAAYGSIESIVNNVEPGFRITFLTGALVLSLIAYFFPDRADGWMSRKK